MGYTVPIRRIYQFEKWKWLLMVGLVAATHLFCQSLILPYGNALLSLIPDGTVHEKVELISKQSAAGKSMILDDPLIDNGSNLANKSLLTRSIKRVGQTDAIAGSRDDEIIMTEETEKENQVLSDSKGIDNAVDFVEDANLDNDMAYEIGNKDELDSVESGDQAHDFDLENNGEIKASLSLEQVVEPNNHTLSDKMPSSSIMMKTELTSANSLVNVTFSGNLASNVSIVNSSNFDASLGEKETIALPSESEGSSVLLHTHATGSSNNSALVSNLAKKKMKCEMPPKTITPIPEMERLLVHRHARSRAMRPRWSSERDREILSAKAQIENAPVIRNDRELYAPLFRNVSTFKKSYELMEQILKIHVYKEGTKPIFHQPILKGLYASEGWFMKLMEGNKRFVVKDPRRAHLFYMPFSSRMLEYTLYVRNSHNRTNLRQYLRDYSEKISSKYRYWNRTGGADHFLVACHDWAPYETRHHMEHCMKALCNADVTLGFKIGRDVSLPETYVRSARNPLRDLGGKPASERHTVAFYAGQRPRYEDLWSNASWRSQQNELHPAHEKQQVLYLSQGL
ncbi:probable glycosyltransferase At5g25310 [Coffea eugenioides]|uniref:probable glycosyltransferase At5g25310 n=1 Tax=Coffea eugenioides TaxID=49369 RepID=UPI000F60EBD3|nr:probable glycosyltransferase At5g25310 [Coffea eugenioides]